MKLQVIAKAYAQSIMQLADVEKISVVDELTKLAKEIRDILPSIAQRFFAELCISVEETGTP